MSRSGHTDRRDKASKRARRMALRLLQAKIEEYELAVKDKAEPAPPGGAAQRLNNKVRRPGRAVWNGSLESGRPRGRGMRTRATRRASPRPGSRKSRARHVVSRPFERPARGWGCPSLTFSYSLTLLPLTTTQGGCFAGIHHLQGRILRGRGCQGRWRKLVLVKVRDVRDDRAHARRDLRAVTPRARTRRGSRIATVAPLTTRPRSRCARANTSMDIGKDVDVAGFSGARVALKATALTAPYSPPWSTLWSYEGAPRPSGRKKRAPSVTHSPPELAPSLRDI